MTNHQSMHTADCCGCGPKHYEYEVWQDGVLQAGGRETDYASAQSEANHYATMYAQDGPVEVRIYEKRLLTTAQAKPKLRRYNASGSLSEYGVFPECDAQVPVAATLDDAAADPALTLDVAREMLRDAAAGIRQLAARATSEPDADTLNKPMSEMKPVTPEHAREALEDMDDYARMDVGVDAKGPRETLERFIADHERVVAEALTDAERYRALCELLRRDPAAPWALRELAAFSTTQWVTGVKQETLDRVLDAVIAARGAKENGHE